MTATVSPSGASPGPPAGSSPGPPGTDAPIVQPRLGPWGWLRWAWRQLTSMRVALALLALLALAAVPGSLLPQRGSDLGGVLRFSRENPTLAPVLDRLSLFDVYSAPWFEAVYVLLFVSLVGCVLPRAKQHVAALRARPAPAPRRLQSASVHRSWITEAAPAAVLRGTHEQLRGRWFRVHSAGNDVAAEKGYLRETGNLAFHLSLLLILVGVAIGHLYGYRANIAVPEGRGFSNSVVQFDEFEPGSALDPARLRPFGVTLDDLQVRYEQSGTQVGTPRDFTARVQVRDFPGADAREAVIRPNSPLEVGGTKVFLLGQGYAPRFTVRDGEGRVVQSGPVILLPQQDSFGMVSTGAIKVPDAAPEQLGFAVTFLPTTARRPAPDGRSTVPVSIFPDAQVPRAFVTAAWRGDLGLDAGRAQSVYRLDTSRMRQVVDGSRPVTAELAPGDTLALPEGLGSITFDGVGRFASFSVAADPGKGAALAAGVLALAGLMISLYLRRRSVWVRATPGSGGHTVVEVAASARTEYEGLEREVDDVVAGLRTGPAPALPEQAHAHGATEVR